MNFIVKNWPGELPLWKSLVEVASIEAPRGPVSFPVVNRHRATPTEDCLHAALTRPALQAISPATAA